MKIEAVIFDLDGTLIDSMGIWTDVDIEFLNRRNIKVPQNIFADLEVGNSFIEIADFFKKKFSLKESIQEIMDEWTKMVEWHYNNDIKLKAGVLEYLEFLQIEEKKLGVGTSNTKYLAEVVLKSNNVIEKFDTIIAGDIAIKGKPFPDIFLKVAKNLGIQPKNCLVIEDVYAGVQAAKNAGMTVFAIEDNYSINDKEKIKNLSDYYATDFYQIMRKTMEILKSE